MRVGWVNSWCSLLGQFNMLGETLSMVVVDRPE